MVVSPNRWAMATGKAASSAGVEPAPGTASEADASAGGSGAASEGGPRHGGGDEQKEHTTRLVKQSYHPINGTP